MALPQTVQTWELHRVHGGEYHISGIVVDPTALANVDLTDMDNNRTIMEGRSDGGWE